MAGWSDSARLWRDIDLAVARLLGEGDSGHDSVAPAANSMAPHPRTDVP